MSLDTSLKVLVVEDSGITRKMEIKALNAVGFTTIVQAEDGDDAIEKLKSEGDVGLIISDWNMPNKNGYDLLVWVRAADEFKHLPFIMATAQGEKKQTVAATEAGVSSFITKPFGPPELKKVIEDTFASPESKAAEPKAASGPVYGKSGKPVIRAAHIQITDHLTLGVAKNMIETEKASPKHFELETVCMPSWNPVQEALENGTVDAAFILAPIAMDLFSYGVPLKLVMFAHKNGSISVSRKSAAGNDLRSALKGKSFYIPHILSIHHMLSTMFLKELGLKPGLAGDTEVDTYFEVVPPVKMPEFLGAHQDSGGFTVAEPLGTKAIASGSAELLFLSGEMWEYHPCCVVVFRKDFLDRHREAVEEFSSLLVESGQFIDKKPEKAAEIAVEFLDPDGDLGLNVPVLKNVLNEPLGIKTDDLYPVKEDLDRIQQYMVNEMGVGSIIDLDEFVDTSFADSAYKNLNIVRHSSRLKDISELIRKISARETEDAKDKANLDREGKYLFFKVGDESYGVNVMSVKEIIGIMPIKSIPRTPDFIKGIINLRGKVIPVVDLRKRFGYEEQEYTNHTCIIVLERRVGTETMLVGVIVDSVSDVMNIKASEVEDTPSFGVKIDTSFIMAVAKIDKSVRSLLNVERMFTNEEAEIIGNVA